MICHISWSSSQWASVFPCVSADGGALRACHVPAWFSSRDMDTTCMPTGMRMMQAPSTFLPDVGTWAGATNVSSGQLPRCPGGFWFAYVTTVAPGLSNPGGLQTGGFKASCTFRSQSSLSTRLVDSKQNASVFICIV